MITINRLATFLVLACLPIAQATENEDTIADELAELKSLILAQQAEIKQLRSRVSELEKDTTSPATPLAQVHKQQSSPIPTAPSSTAKPTASSKYGVKFYGYVKLDATYETQRTSAVDLGFFALPESGNGDDDALSFTAKETRLGLILDGPTAGDWKTGGRLEMDFYGSGSQNGANPRMRLAYLTASNNNWSILAGQNWDTWMTVLPKTVNFATFGRHGSLWSRRAQLKATRHLNLGEDKLSLSLALARTIGKGDIDGAGDGLDGGADAAVPMIQWNAVYQPSFGSGKAKFALGGHYGTEDLEQSAVNREEEFVTSLIMASFSLPFTKKFTLSGAFWKGENLSNFQGGIAQGINLAKNTEVEAQGGWIQARFFPTDTLNFNLAYGLDDPEDSDLSSSGRTENTTIAASVYWNILKATTLAFEYQHIETEYASGLKPSTNRFQSALIFAF